MTTIVRDGVKLHVNFDPTPALYVAVTDDYCGCNDFLRVLASSEPHVEPARPRGREYVLMLIAVVLAAVVFL